MTFKTALFAFALGLSPMLLAAPGEARVSPCAPQIRIALSAYEVERQRIKEIEVFTRSSQRGDKVEVTGYEARVTLRDESEPTLVLLDPRCGIKQVKRPQ